MIASVDGVVQALRADGVVVAVGGVGIAVQTTPGTRARLRVGQDVQLATTLVVREDSLTLFGFADSAERDVFELLQSASGVGPRLALAVLTVHPPDAVRQALASEDVAALVLVPGIGRKGAQRMVLELKDKAGAVATAVVAPAAGPAWKDTLVQALIGLGWSAAQSQEAVDRLAEEHPGASEQEVPVLLRQALGQLGRAR